MNFGRLNPHWKNIHTQEMKAARDLFNALIEAHTCGLDPDRYPDLRDARATLQAIWANPSGAAPVLTDGTENLTDNE